jgi:hypothetical protein
VGQLDKIPDDTHQIAKEDAPAGEQCQAQDAQRPPSRIAFKAAMLRSILEVSLVFQVQQVVASFPLFSILLKQRLYFSTFRFALMLCLEEQVGLSQVRWYRDMSVLCLLLACTACSLQEGLHQGIKGGLSALL